MLGAQRTVDTRDSSVLRTIDRLVSCVDGNTISISCVDSNTISVSCEDSISCSIRKGRQ
jgi:hypothetical protein